MKSLLTLSITLAFATPLTAADKGKWVSIFNGKNLDGWTVKITGYKSGENFGNTFRVKDGVMQVGYEKYDSFAGKFGHIFYKEKLSHYRFRMQYRFVGKQAPKGPGWAFRNSGIMLHCQSPESMGKNQKFPVSIEVQLLGGNGKGERPTANLCTPGTNVVIKGKLHKPHCKKSTSKTYHGDQWVTVEVEVKGDEVVRHIVNGTTVFEYTKTQYDPRDADAKKLIAKSGGVALKSGYISLQSESHPVEFRKIEIMKLDK